MDQAQQVLSLYQEKYTDFNVRHFHEKLAGEHQIELSYTWVKKALQLAGLVKTHKRGKHRKRRPRRPIPGMMLHIDGSEHQWLAGQWHDLIVVLDDANVENAARAAVWGAFANCGQSCSSVERCYVHESIAELFIAQVVKETRRLHQGAGTDKTTDVGSMSSERQLRIVERHVNQAIDNGAVALTGGERLREVTGPFYPPTVLTNVNHNMDVMREETFGPVLPIMNFRTEEEAVRLANDSDFGLTASVWTNNIARGQRLAARIDAGTVMINEVFYTHGIAQTPWGGVKQSGLGRTHGRAGLLELVHSQHIHVNRLPFIPDLWWFNYDEGAGQLFRGFARRFSSGSILQTTLLLPQMIRRWREPRN
jgi:succinate-semialdehyde dehydrogenase/glutarate-semialdehyde dehydrogenase